MNTDNIRALAQRLRSPATVGHFSMNTWMVNRTKDISSTPIGQSIHDCGTVACIGGYAAIMAKPTASKKGLVPRDVAQTFLGISNSLGAQLFAPYSGDYNWNRITADVAADVLDHLAETGKVEWPDSVRVVK